MKKVTKKTDKTVFERLPIYFYRRHFLIPIQKGMHIDNSDTNFKTFPVALCLLLIESMRNFGVPFVVVKQLCKYYGSLDDIIKKMVIENKEMYLVIHENNRLSISENKPETVVPCVLIPIRYFIKEASDAVYNQPLP